MSTIFFKTLHFFAKVAEKFNLSDKTIKRDISKLKKENKLIRTGSLKTGKWKIVN